MTITEDELARLESRAKAGLLGTRQDDADAIAAVAEVRRLRADLDLSERARDTMLSAVTERDAIRAENERLHRRILELEMDTHPVDAALDREGMLP